MAAKLFVPQLLHYGVSHDYSSKISRRCSARKLGLVGYGVYSGVFQALQASQSEDQKGLILFGGFIPFRIHSHI